MDGTGTPGPPLPAAARVEVLASALRSRGPVGDALRVLVRRLRFPGESCTHKQIETLLLLTIALKRAGMWP